MGKKVVALYLLKISCFFQVIIFTATRFCFEIKKGKKKIRVLQYFHNVTTFIIAELMLNMAHCMIAVEATEKILTTNSD